MFPLPSTAGLLATLLLAVGSFGLGGWLGHRLASGDAARKDVAAFSQAHARAVDNAIDDKRLAVERARAHAAAQRATEVVYFEGVKDAHLSASAVCDWTPASFSLLIHAINIANGSAKASAGSVSDAVPGSTASEGEQRSGDSPVGTQGGGGLRSLPPSTRGLSREG